MAKGFYISNFLAMVAVLFSVAAIATIISLAVVYANAKGKGTNSVPSVPPTKSTDSEAYTTVGPSTPQPNNPWNRLRLPKSLIPRHYDVELQPYLEKNSEGLYIFKGQSTVYFQCVNATNLVLIHSNKLNYTLQNGYLVSLAAMDGSPTPAIKSTWLETTTNYLVIELSSDLVAGKDYSVYGKYIGELADDLAGFYRSEYKEGEETRIIATTQMQACDARKAFPCFDEPAMKATFNITLIHMPQYVALSNMPNISTVQRVIDSVTWDITTFEKTRKMSTYLLAFIVSDFDNVVDQTNNRVQVRIWARKAAIKANHSEYALKVTWPILSFYETYFNTSYPLPKSDQVALPDFSAGAMENWGLVTYRETALLYDPLVSSIGNKERVLIVIAHELAHQWFGNLVTLRWWNDLWLNEGFASYVEYLGADKAEPTWNIKDMIVQNEVYRAMGVDALASSHPLSSKEEEVNTPAEISELFDTIAYSKGAAVIRMLSEFLTEDLFKEGLRSYLHAFEYGNTIYDDLWVHLQMAVANQTSLILPKTIKDIMDTWTLQMGFPVVTVDTTSGMISQKHFLLDPESNVTRLSEFNYTWIVPITSMKSGSLQPNYWLEQTSANSNIFKVDKSNDWILANINVTGYYRVTYDQENWKRLIKQLGTDRTAIPVLNRAQIIDDAFNLARAKLINVTSALETTRFLDKETEYIPWEAALRSLDYFTLMFDRSDVYSPMKKYLLKQVTTLFQHFENITGKWTNLPEGLMDQYNEINAIRTACSSEMQVCLTRASDLYKKWMEDPIKSFILPNLRTPIYCYAIERGGEKEWNFAWEMFKNATVATEGDKLRGAMACAKEPWILNRYLEYTLDPTKIRRQDAVSTINYIASNVVGQNLAWDFIRRNWQTLFNQYGGGSFSIASLIGAVTRRFSTKFDLQQLEQFKKDNEHIGFGSATRALEQALEKTKTNIKWVEENREPIRQWFENEVKQK